MRIQFNAYTISLTHSDKEINNCFNFRWCVTLIKKNCAILITLNLIGGGRVIGAECNSGGGCWVVTHCLAGTEWSLCVLLKDIICIIAYTSFYMCTLQPSFDYRTSFATSCTYIRSNGNKYNNLYIHFIQFNTNSASSLFISASRISLVSLLAFKSLLSLSLCFLSSTHSLLTFWMHYTKTID